MSGRRVAPDQNQARFGYLSSQFHFRTLMQSFPVDFPVEFTDSTSAFALPSEQVANDSKVFRVAGDFQSHYTYVFNVDGGLLLYDSPLNNRRSAATLLKVRDSFSTLPIKYVVNSHNHFDHVGGIRGNLAEEGDLVVGSGSKTVFEEILARPYTILPNPLNRTVNVIAVSGEKTIGTGDERLVLYTLPTAHAEKDDFILIYKPSTKTIYSSDVYNPGFSTIFDTTSSETQQRLVLLAKNLVDFVDAKGLDVETAYGTHGFATTDFEFSTIRSLAER